MAYFFHFSTFLDENTFSEKKRHQSAWIFAKMLILLKSLC